MSEFQQLKAAYQLVCKSNHAEYISNKAILKDIEGLIADLHFLFLAEQETSDLQQQLIQFLYTRWLKIAGGKYSYFHTPNAPSTKLCFAIAQYLDPDNPYRYLVPTSAASYNHNDMEDSLGKCGIKKHLAFFW